MVLAVALFVAGLYTIVNSTGRAHLRGGVWIVGTFLVVLLVSYVGE